MTPPAAAPRQRYEILDGLRGVAALLVIWYHVFEAFATSPVDQRFNHGYLAVDFFFVLSGFVIGHAYDSRWQRGMTAGRFIVRRIIRLQPMVIIGVLLGVVSFIIQSCERWDGTAVSTSAVIASFLFGLFMLPALPGTMPEVRGNGEMFPLNGPSWSLFFEYIGSIGYALWLHRLSRRGLRLFTVLSGVALAVWTLSDMSGSYHTGFGWSMADYGFVGGLLRLSFSFSAGLLMARGFKPMRVRACGFAVCSALIVAMLAMPYITTDGSKSIANACYDLICTLLVFPAVVYIGASTPNGSGVSDRVCRFLGSISYPVYIIHYPMMYLFYAYVWSEGLTFAQTWPVAVAICLGAIILARLFLKYYDEPLRACLSKKL